MLKEFFLTMQDYLDHRNQLRKLTTHPDEVIRMAVTLAQVGVQPEQLESLLRIYVQPYFWEGPNTVIVRESEVKNLTIYPGMVIYVMGDMHD